MKSNVRKKKRKGIIECDKSTIISDIDTAQCNKGIVKFETKKKRKERIPLNVTKVALDVGVA